MPFKLQEGEVRVISLEQCQSYFDMKTITTRMICAGYESGTVDSCMVSCFLIIEVIQFSNNSRGPTQTHCYSREALRGHFWKMTCQQMCIWTVMSSIRDPASPRYCLHALGSLRWPSARSSTASTARASAMGGKAAILVHLLGPF